MRMDPDRRESRDRIWSLGIIGIGTSVNVRSVAIVDSSMRKRCSAFDRSRFIMPGRSMAGVYGGPLGAPQ
jgi:hypothetical protein